MTLVQLLNGVKEDRRWVPIGKFSNEVNGQNGQNSSLTVRRIDSQIKRDQWASMNPSSMDGTSSLQGSLLETMTLAAKHLRVVNWSGLILQSGISLRRSIGRCEVAFRASMWPPFSKSVSTIWKKNFLILNLEIKYFLIVFDLDLWFNDKRP